MIRWQPALGLMLSLTTALHVHAGPAQDLSFSADCRRAESNAVLSFVGDILIHDGLYQYAVMGSNKGFKKIWEKTDGLIKKADFSVANLEGPAALGLDAAGRERGDVGFIYQEGQHGYKGDKSHFIYSGTNFVFNFHPRIMRDLKDSGYDLLTLANNHSLDRRAKGIDLTLQAAASAGLVTVGTRPSYDKGAEFYKVASVRGINIAFIGCTEMTNGFSDKQNQVLNCNESRDKISHMISVLSAHPGVDAVIVLPHWGTEYAAKPNATQKATAKKFLDAGATAIVGSHPHVLQPWEKYVTPDGRETVIMYSLGNFVAFQAALERKTGVVTYLGLTKQAGKTSISGVGFTPTLRDSYQIIPLNKMPAEIANLVDANFGTKNRLAPNDGLSRFCR